MNRRNIVVILASASLTVVITYTLYFSLAPSMRRSRENPQCKDDIATRQPSGPEMATGIRQRKENAQPVKGTVVSSLSTQTGLSPENGSEMQKLPKPQESVAESQTIRDTFRDVQPSRKAEPESRESSETPSRADPAVIRRSAIAKRVENREPIGVSQRVSVRQQRVYCWMHVLNGEGERITVRWIRRGNKTTETQLPVGSNSWRTWACAYLRPAMVGPAWVEILDESGELLKTLSFKITE